MEPEEWRSVPGYSNYEVSNFGRVRCQGHLKWGGPRAGYYWKPAQLLSPGIASHGYPTVHLTYEEGKARTRTVHSLVAEVFIGPCPTGQEVRHKDDNRLNPSLDNLEYGTRSQNIRDMFNRGRNPDKKKDWGKAKKTMLDRYGEGYARLIIDMSHKARKLIPNSYIDAAQKTVETRNKRYGPDHTRKGFAGIKYSREYDL